jgi:hypothetical protein
MMTAPLAQAADAAPASDGTALLVAGVALAVSISALALAWYARRSAVAAEEEAGQARARAAQSAPGGVTSEALAAAERVWSSRLAALESQVLVPGARSAARPVGAISTGSGELATRVEELERVVGGMNVALKDLRRATPARERNPEPPPQDAIAWPAFLAGDDSGIRDVRLALTPAVTAGDPAARELLDRLRQTERWPVTKPSAAELAAALREISAQLFAVLRRDGLRGPLDAAMFGDRVLAVLRPSWKPFLPHLDCRSMLPGTTLDPDWMEDRTPAGLRRPVISEMLSWAVFEKLDHGRRVLAKARVTTE